MRRIMAIILILILIGANVFAEFSREDSVKYRFNPIVVTATKVAGAQKDIAASISIIDEKMIQRSNASSVMDIVKDHVPSVYITERAVYGYGVAAGAAGGISIRGVGGSPVTGVLVLRDGRPDIMGQMGHPIPDAYSLAGVERIEIVRGPASFLYGTNAMGGVINIVSKKINNAGFYTKINSGAASYNSRKLSMFHGGNLGPLEYNLTAGTKYSDGHRDFSQYEGDFYTAHIGYNIGPNTNVSLNANLSNIYLLDPGSTIQPKKDNWYDLRRSGVDLTVNHSSNLGDSYLRLHGNFGCHKIFDGWRSQDKTIGLMLYHNYQLFNGNISTIGFDIKRYGGQAEESLVKAPVIDYSNHDITEYAPYIHTQQMLLKRFMLSAGVRIENHELYGNKVLPKFGFVTHVSSNSSVRISAAKGFRSPAIRELYVFPPRNESLLPERLWNYEIGLTQNISKWAKLDVCLFQSKGDNKIRLIAPPPQYINSGEFDFTGYELIFEWLPMKALTFKTTWSKIDLGDETMQTPGKKLTTFITYDFRYFQLSAHLLSVRDLYGADFRKNKMDNYTVLNLIANVQPFKFIGLQFGLKNVLDENYQTYYNYPMPGRMITFDINYTL